MVKSTADKNETKKNTISIENQLKILIIDDERLLRQSLKRILEKAGFYCEMAMDYSSAKKNIENLDFDAILVDIILPKMNGIELITKLQEEFSINSAVIFITGEPNLETCRKAIKIGAFNYLEKPVSRILLIESIKQALIRRNNQISFKKKEGKKTYTLTENILSKNETKLSEKQQNLLSEEIESIHTALLLLKKKYGAEFNDEQRNQLNVIATNNSSMRKLLKDLKD